MTPRRSLLGAVCACALGVAHLASLAACADEPAAVPDLEVPLVPAIATDAAAPPAHPSASAGAGPAAPAPGGAPADPGACAKGALQTIEETVLAEDVSYFATFDSHNQKVVETPYGIFLTYVPRRYLIDGAGGSIVAGTSSTWRLLRSVDGGKTFGSLYERSGEIAQAPALDADPLGNVYLAYGLGASAGDDARYYQFLASGGFQTPLSARIRNGGGGKFTLLFDRTRSRAYYFADIKSASFLSISDAPSFYRLSPSGSDIAPGFAMRKGNVASIEYPYLAMANGTVVAAWTTQDNDVYRYEDIHVMRSRDGGRSWETLRGDALGSSIVSDRTGPVPRIDAPEEAGQHTWLANLLYKNGKLHFMYEAANIGRHHYQRFDLGTGARDVDQPAWKGESLVMAARSGFFATESDADDSPLFAVVRDATGRLAALVSRDNGETWHDYAVGAAQPKTDAVAFIGGARSVTRDGYVIGAYTLLGPSGFSDVPAPAAKLVFFKLNARCL